ncbi:MAG: hypothetical protein ACFCD0_13355 [Gemmataceae bacterium]
MMISTRTIHGDDNVSFSAFPAALFGISSLLTARMVLEAVGRGVSFLSSLGVLGGTGDRSSSNFRTGEAGGAGMPPDGGTGGDAIRSFVEFSLWLVPLGELFGYKVRSTLNGAGSPVPETFLIALAFAGGISTDERGFVREGTGGGPTSGIVGGEGISGDEGIVEEGIVEEGMEVPTSGRGTVGTPVGGGGTSGIGEIPVGVLVFSVPVSNGGGGGTEPLDFGKAGDTVLLDVGIAGGGTGGTSGTCRITSVRKMGFGPGPPRVARTGRIVQTGPGHERGE